MHNLIFWVFFFLVSCRSAEIRYTDPVNILSDDYWISNDTLQIQVEGIETDNVPYVLRREKACNKAKESIDQVIIKKYSRLEGMKYSYRIYKALYTEKNNCRLVVHVHMKNLKEVIQ